MHIEKAPRSDTYLSVEKGRLIHPYDGGCHAHEIAGFVHDQLKALLLDSRYPCVGAKAAINQETYRFGLYGQMGGDSTSDQLARDLLIFVDEQLGLGGEFTTFIASFEGPTPTDEKAFESQLWNQLQQLHDRDTAAWDPDVSENPDDAQFSFSFGGRAFFLVGLHAASSRWARRFTWPTIVFNAHFQFEHLRETGRFDRFQSLIRGRDTKLQGSINPNLADFGKDSEARQYSGRRSEEAWRCPLEVHRRS